MPFQKQHPLQNWIPLRLKHDASGVLVEWMYIGTKRFIEPFFEDTISAIRKASTPPKFKSVSTPEMLIQWSEEIQAVKPAAFIFHVSRCGSTLLSQILSMDPRNIVLSEVPVLDEILRMPFKNKGWNTGDVTKYLQAAINFYGQAHSDSPPHLFIKTDSWHLHFYALLRNAFPGIPFVLLYRDPAEVLASQQKKRGLHAVPGLIEQQLFDFTGAPELNLDLHLANVLASYYRQMMMIVNIDPLAMLFNYRDGITELATQVYADTGLNLPPALQEQFTSRSQYHAKAPQEVFAGDYDGKNAPAFLEGAFELYTMLDKRCSSQSM